MMPHQPEGQQYDLNGNPSNAYTRQDARDQLAQGGQSPERRQELERQTQVARGRQHDEYAQARERQRIREAEAARRSTASDGREERRRAKPN